MQRTNRLYTNRGFTLIEVLIVLVIVLAIGGIVAVNLMPKREQAIGDVVRVQLDALDQAMEQFYLDYERYPSTEEGISVLWDKTQLEDEDDQDKHPGNYLKKKNLKDYWGSDYGYRGPEDAEEEGYYELWSNGKDTEEETEDDIRARSWYGDEEDEFGDAGGG